MQNLVAQDKVEYRSKDMRACLPSVCADPGYKIKPERMATLDLGLFDSLCGLRTPPNRICFSNISAADTLSVGTRMSDARATIQRSPFASHC